MINLSTEFLYEDLKDYFINNKNNFKLCLSYELNSLIELTINGKEYKYNGGYYINRKLNFLILRNCNFKNFYKLDDENIGIKYSKLIDLDLTMVKVKINAYI
jgi:pectate lyase